MINKKMFFQNSRQFGTLLGLIILMAIFWSLSSYFLTLSNLINVAQQTAINAIIAVGMTYVIISAGIDLSVGSVLAFSAVVMADLMHSDMFLPFAILIGLVIGLAWGLLNGVLISYAGLPPFIATLGTMSVARGATLLYTDGHPISSFPPAFRYLATGEIFSIPVSIIIMVVIYLIAHFILSRTRLGRYTYAIGGNEVAANLSGINTKLIKTVIYGISGLLSALAGVILTGRLNSAQPIAGMMYELDAIAAVVIGGTSLLGGVGRMSGTLIGALIMGVLRNGLNLLGVSSFIQQIVIGSVIIAAVVIDMVLKKRSR